MSTHHQKVHWGVYWRLLQDVPDESLAQAFDTCFAEPGNFFPSPGDVLAKIPGTKAMGADEAWAIALTSYDESASIVWSAAIEQARSIAKPIWVGGDKIGARMAFKDAYTRLVQDPSLRQAKLSLGTEPQGRAEAVRQARKYGIIKTDAHAKLLAPEDPDVDPDVADALRRLTGKVAATTQTPPSEYQAKFKAAVDAGFKLAAAAKAIEDKRAAQAEAQRREHREKVLARARAALAAKTQAG